VKQSTIAVHVPFRNNVGLSTKYIPLLLYGLEACPLLKSDLSSLDFTINRFFMKLFKSNNMEIITYCQPQFSFDLSSVLWAKRVRAFNLKFGNLTIPITWTCSVGCVHVCNMIFTTVFVNVLTTVSLVWAVLEVCKLSFLIYCYVTLFVSTTVWWIKMTNKRQVVIPGKSRARRMRWSRERRSLSHIVCRSRLRDDHRRPLADWTQPSSPPATPHL